MPLSSAHSSVLPRGPPNVHAFVTSGIKRSAASAELDLCCRVCRGPVERSAACQYSILVDGQRCADRGRADSWPVRIGWWRGRLAEPGNRCALHALEAFERLRISLAQLGPI